MEMKLDPILSFVIPVYNSEKTLRECVDSILNQGEKNIEIILVDDGSKEVCKNLCDTITMENKNIVHTVHKKNGGSLSARIEGAKKAKGDYIVYVDSDDIILPNTLEMIKNNIEKYPAEIYLYDYIMDNVDKLGNKVIKLFNYTEIKIFTKKLDMKEVYINFMNGMLNTMATTVISKNLLEKTFQLSSLGKITVGEDRLQKLFILKYARKIVYIPKSFYYYCWTNNSQSSNLRKNKISRNLYNDFKVVWKYEQENYKFFDLNYEEIEKYNKEKLNRICNIIKQIFLTNDYLKKEKQKLFSDIVYDNFFQSLLEDTKISTERIYIQIFLKLLKRKNYFLTFIYLKGCEILRSLKYRKGE